MEINGQPVERGDLIVLMASPDSGSSQRPTDTFCIVTRDLNSNTEGIAQVPYLVLRELLSKADRYALLDAVRERRQLLESGNALGIFALIWKRPEPKPQVQAPFTVSPLDFLDAFNYARGPVEVTQADRRVNNGVLVHGQTWVNLDKAAERLADLMNKRALGIDPGSINWAG